MDKPQGSRRKNHQRSQFYDDNNIFRFGNHGGADKIDYYKKEQDSDTEEIAV